MSMPGFTAEASLHRTSESYRGAGTFDPLAGAAKVVPQQCFQGFCNKPPGQLLGLQTWWCFFGGKLFTFQLPCV